MSDHYHYDYASAHHDHREYAPDRHDHDGDYAALHHRHHDDESTARGLREDLGRAEARIGGLEDEVGQLRRQLDGVLAQIRVLDRLRPSCVICRDAAADRQTVNGPACSDCAGDLPDDGPDASFPGPWAFAEGDMSDYERGQS
jgi:hypothetical protein